MTDKEIIQALRLRSCESSTRNCPTCPLSGNDDCVTDALSGAADIIERLTAENAKAEAERDALLEYAKTMQECEMCKNDTFCHLRDPMKDDCKHCQRASDCPCQKCEENNCWEWRGLPKAPEEGEKA